MAMQQCSGKKARVGVAYNIVFLTKIFMTEKTKKYSIKEYNKKTK